MSLFLPFLLTIAHAQEDPPPGSDTETKDDTEDTEGTQNEAAEIPSPPTDQQAEDIPQKETVDPIVQEPKEKPPVPSNSEAIMGVQLTLKNGVPLKGFSPILSVINWKEGQSIYIRIQDAWMYIESERIAGIRPLEDNEQATLNPAPQRKSTSVYRDDIEASRLGYGYKNYTSSRYVYAPSAIPMKAGEGYVSEKLFVFTSAAYAINDNWTILGGTFTWFPPVLFILGTKFSYPVAPNIHVSVGGESFMSGIAGFESLATIGFGGITFGDEEQNITINAGVGEVFNEPGYPVSIAAMARISERMVILTENWYIHNPNGDFGSGLAIASLSFRFVPPPKSNNAGKNVWVTDVGLFGVFPLDYPQDGMFPLPLLEFSYFF